MPPEYIGVLTRKKRLLLLISLSIEKTVFFCILMLFIPKLLTWHQYTADFIVLFALVTQPSRVPVTFKKLESSVVCRSALKKWYHQHNRLLHGKLNASKSFTVTVNKNCTNTVGLPWGNTNFNILSIYNVLPFD